MVASNVEGPVVNADNSRTWTITINDNLRFSDGTPITAENYVFTYLIISSPAMSWTGTDEDNPLPNLGNNQWVNNREILGAEAFRRGEADEIIGVRLIDDFTWSITIEYETDGMLNFPYFYELTYIDVNPTAMHVFAPGLNVVDTGTGVRMSGEGLTYDLLRSTVDDGLGNGLRYTMGPTAGPYFLAAPVDMVAETMVLQINPYFHGTYDGFVPSIETVILRSLDSAIQFPAFQQGEIDLLTGLAGTHNVLPAFEMIAEGEGRFDYRGYPRNGSGALFFHWDVGPTQFVEVRRAIAWTLDRVEFNNMWSAGHATTIDSLVNLGAWMFQENQDIFPSLITYNYTLNLANATRELEEGGWVYNADGGDWQAGDGPRHKMVDGELMPLVVRWGSPDSNEIGAMLSSLMTEPANSVGIFFDQVFLTTADFSPALTGRDPENRFSMVNGGVGIPVIDAVWFSHNPDPAFHGDWNWTRADDPELFEYALARRNATTREEYLEAWKGFIARYNIVLPALPTNADIWYDVFRDNLENYHPSALWQFSHALVRAHLTGHGRN
jgi:peptide/nickel transport system substrate-binding protein